MNIIYILADDMGYGDLRANNPHSRIPTPNLDRLAARGMRFTDAHASSAVCTPSRYGILTGRYNWRSRLKQGIVWEWDGALIEPDQLTVAGFLQSHGYDTACIGKWHLGWDWATKDGKHPNETLPFGVMHGVSRDQRCQFGMERIDFTKRIGGGPVDRGFDSYFGIDVPNFPPYAWFENDRLTEPPTTTKPAGMYGHDGPAVANWSLEAMIPTFVDKAVDYIEAHAPAEHPDAKPFFLYFPLTSPHSPVVPNEQFKGLSGIGNYGDFVCEVDWVVGQVVEALERTGQFDDTLIIFTSDNGPERGVPDDEGVYERAQRTNHYSMGPLRGMKRDAWEGGHRVPFVAACPSVIPAGTTCDQPVCLTDLIATCADIVSAKLPDGAGPDSVSMWPLLRGGTDQPTRESLVHHSMSGKFALRRGDWVYIESPSVDENNAPDWFNAERGYEPHDQPAELYNLRDDLPERVNRYADESKRVAELAAELHAIRGSDAVPHESFAGGELTE